MAEDLEIVINERARTSELAILADTDDKDDLS